MPPPDANRVIITDPGGKPVAWLDDKLVWQSDDAVIADRLNTHHSPRNDTGVAAVMPVGVIAAERGAADVGGVAVYPPGYVQPLSEGEVG